MFLCVIKCLSIHFDGNAEDSSWINILSLLLMKYVKGDILSQIPFLFLFLFSVSYKAQVVFCSTEKSLIEKKEFASADQTIGINGVCYLDSSSGQLDTYPWCKWEEGRMFLMIPVDNQISPWIMRSHYPDYHYYYWTHSYLTGLKMQPQKSTEI